MWNSKSFHPVITEYITNGGKHSRRQVTHVEREAQRG